MSENIENKNVIIQKSQPSISQVHVNRPLTEISINYMQEAKDFIADKLCPIVPVDHKTNIYPVYTKEYWLTSNAALRAPGTESAGRGFGIDFTNTYNCQQFSIHYDVPDQIRANTDAPLNMDRDATLLVTQDLLINKEIRLHNALLKPGIWTKDYAGTATGSGSGEVKQWSKSGSDPISDIYAGKVYVKMLTGKEPNKMVISRDVFEVLKKHPAIIDRYKYTTSNVPTIAMLAQLFEVDEILVSNAVVNTANEGGTFSGNFLMSSSVLLAYVAPGAGLMQPSAAYNFSFNTSGMPGATVAVKSFRMEWLETDRIEGTTFFDPKLIANDLGVFFKTLI